MRAAHKIDDALGRQQPTLRAWRRIGSAKEGELIGEPFLRGRLLYRRRRLGLR
jgi:hypothetical protein